MARAKRRTQQTIRIGDVARHAGVSTMTVSRVMNSPDAVRQETRERVLSAVKSLNYQPNLSARRLARGTDVLIGLIYANPSDSYLGRFLKGALDAARRTDSHLIVDICTDGTPAAYAASARRLVKANVAGVILPPPISGSHHVLELLADLEIPVATVANNTVQHRAMDIHIADEAAARAMTEHLIALGHRRIGFITGTPGQMTSRLRERGFRAAMQGAGLEIDPDMIVPGQFSYVSGIHAAQHLLQHKHRPSAIFASNDDMAAAAIGVAHRCGLTLPDDLSVVGFDNSPAATTVWPELTTIDQPVSAMADAALNLVLAMIRGDQGDRLGEPVIQTHRHTLVLRGSSGPLHQKN